MPVISKWRTALKGGFLGAIGAVLGTMLVFTYDFLRMAVPLASYFYDYKTGAFLILMPIESMPVCALLGVVNGLILRSQARRRALPTRRAIGIGALVGAIVGLLIVLAETLLQWKFQTQRHTGRWLLRALWFEARSAAWIVMPAAAVGAWHGWRMGRWLRKKIPGVEPQPQQQT